MELQRLEKLLAHHEKDPLIRTGQGYFQGRDDLDFHFTIAEASHNLRLAAFVSGPLYSVMRLYRYRFSAAPGRAVKALAEHKAILKALMERDQDAAESAMREHIRNSRDNLFQIVRGEAESLHTADK